MSTSQIRSLTGDPTGVQHLVELRAPIEGEWCAASEQLLLMSLRGRVRFRGADDVEWLMEEQHYAWVVSGDTVHLAAESARQPADVLVWRFCAEALPEAMHAWLPKPGSGLVRDPAPLTPSMQTLLLALRGCPVAPALRNLWGTGKLIELLALLLPAPVSSSSGADFGNGDSRAGISSTPRVLHPAIRAAIDWMTARLAEPIGLSEIAGAANSSPSHLSRLFTAEFGHGPTEHLRRLRLDHAAALLRSGQANVTEAAFAAGYQSLGQFSRAFSNRHGRPPSAFIRRA